MNTSSRGKTRSTFNSFSGSGVGAGSEANGRLGYPVVRPPNRIVFTNFPVVTPPDDDANVAIQLDFTDPDNSEYFFLLL